MVTHSFSLLDKNRMDVVDNEDRFFQILFFIRLQMYYLYDNRRYWIKYLDSGLNALFFKQNLKIKGLCKTYEL